METKRTKSKKSRRHLPVEYKLTWLAYAAMNEIKHGADVYDRMLAGVLRGLQRIHPELLDITKPMTYTGNGVDQMPYFGAILTKKGFKVLSSRLD